MDTNKNMLAGSRIYLCGQIENAADSKSWRHLFAQQLPQIIPNVKVWDPMIKPSWVSDDVQNDQIAFKWKSEIFGGDIAKGERCWIANQSVRRLCKQLASKCDILVARITKEFTWGSIDELEIAALRRIPVFLILPDGPISIYGLSGIIYNYQTIPHMVHTNEESMLRSISKINKGEIDICNIDPETWMYITWKNAGESK